MKASPPHPHHHHHHHHHHHPRSNGAFASFFRRLPHMSTAAAAAGRCLYVPPKLDAEVRDFEEALSQELEALRPQGDGRILCLTWLSDALSLAVEKHKDAVRLIPDGQFPLSPCDHKWMNDYMDQTTRVMDLCNILTAEISDMEQGNLLIRHVIHTLQDARVSLSTEKVSRALGSLRQWIELSFSTNIKGEECFGILQEMSKGLVAPTEKDVSKGRGFLLGLYGANASAVFVLYALAVALTRGKELLTISLDLPAHLLWSSSILALLQLVKDEARGFRHFAQEDANGSQFEGSGICVTELHFLSNHVATLLTVLESCNMKQGLSLTEEQPKEIKDTDKQTLSLNEEQAKEIKDTEKQSLSLTEEQAKKIEDTLEVLGRFLDDIAGHLDVLGAKLTEMFNAVVASRSYLLDRLGNFGGSDGM